MNNNILSAHNLSIGYTDKNGLTTTVLRSFSLNIQQNEVVMILGASGTGKSSLLRCLGLLQTPFSGSVNISNTRQTAFVFQSPALLPWLTVYQNIAFGSDFKNQPKIEDEAVCHILKEVGLFDSANKKPAELSGGMAARVALARALVRNPDIIFLDEPFASLDAITRHDMQRLLLQMAKTHHTAAVMVTHDIDEALLLADRIVLLGQSRLIDEWQLNEHFQRQSDDLGYQTIRKEILNALSIAQENRQQTDTVEFVI